MDGPNSSNLPEHWRNFSEAAARSGSSSSSVRRALSNQDSQIMGLTGPAAAGAAAAGAAADAGKVRREVLCMWEEGQRKMPSSPHTNPPTH